MTTTDRARIRLQRFYPDLTPAALDAVLAVAHLDAHTTDDGPGESVTGAAVVAACTAALIGACGWTTDTAVTALRRRATHAVVVTSPAGVRMTYGEDANA